MTPSIQSLKRAVAIAEQIQNLQAELSSLLGGRSSVGNASGVVTISPAPAKKKKGKMSAAGRAAIIAAQKLRWAKIKGASAAPKLAATSGKKRKKGKMSAAGRAAIVAAQKLRWAKIKSKKA